MNHQTSIGRWHNVRTGRSVESVRRGQPRKPFWDAAKKSLDAVQKPVNLSFISRIKVPCPAVSWRAVEGAQLGLNDSIIGRSRGNSVSSKKISVTSWRLAVITQ